ncbi:MAG: hypothetical protein H6719_19330 [Sandaracinaceae bacterium]|nr:hypothetical protein [Sandaracinaceae bacterium]
MSAVTDDRPEGPPVTRGPAGVVQCAEAFRAALAAGDVDRVQSMRWLAPRPAGERDLLSDLAAAEGLAHAIRELSRFWRRAQVRLDRVREVDALEAEVYEHLELPSEILPIVTVLRREKSDAPWKVVCTNEAYDERCVVWLPVAVAGVDDTSLTEALPPGSELLLDGDSGVLAHDTWLVHVRGPVLAEAWPAELPGQTPQLFELATALAADPADRRAQLRWLLECGRSLLPELGGDAVYLKRERRVMMPQAIDAILGGAATPSQAVRFWARIERAEAHVYTDGLRLLGLPEIEAPEALFADPTAARDLVEWLAERFVRAEQMAALGTEVSVGDRSLLLVGGRRGPRRGHSYGRCGAVRLVDADGVVHRGSRSRMRAPDEIAAKV